MRLLINHVIIVNGEKHYKKADIIRIPIRLGTDAFLEKKISEKTLEKMIFAMKAYANLMKAHHVEKYRACATSAMREAENGAEIIEQIKENNWIINEANLVFYVDRSALDVAMVNSKNEPPRLFLYDMETNLPLYKPINEVNETNTPLGLYLNYDGLLQKNASGKGEKYKFRITEWLNDVIVRDDVNATLGLTTTASILVPQPPSQLNPVAEAPYLTNLILQKDNEEMIYPSRSIASPLSTVLYGTNVAPENMDKKLKLEIFYTETN